MKNIVFMGEKPLALKCLKHLLTFNEVNLLGICTRKKTDGVWWGEQVLREYCEQKNIPIIKRKNILKLKQVDIIFSILYPFIIGKEIIDKAEYGAFNLHGGPLPRYKGCNSVSHAIMNDEKIFGPTLHFMSPELDSGDIIEIGHVEITNEMTAKELYDKTSILSFELFKKHLPSILEGKVESTPQDHNAEYFIYARDSLDNKEVDFNWPERKIYNFIRALEFPPFEKAYIIVDNNKIYLSTKT
jgi:methionyl-tRNA formyltransferase